MKTITKELEGKTVWLWPTGNNARCHRNTTVRDLVETATIIKVARVNVTLQFAHSRWEKKLRISEYNPQHLIDVCNAGWLVFESEQEIDDYQELLTLSVKLSRHLNYQNDFKNLGLTKCKQLAEMLGVDDDENNN